MYLRMLIKYDLLCNYKCKVFKCKSIECVDRLLIYKCKLNPDPINSRFTSTLSRIFVSTTYNFS